MADRRGALIPFIIIAWIVLSPEPARIHPGIPDGRPLIDDVIAEEQRWLGVIQNSTWDTQFGSEGHTLNVTGLEPERDYAWESLGNVKSRAREQLAYSLGDWGTNALDAGTEEHNPTPLYGNVTGYIRGKWQRSKLQESVPIPQLNISAYAPHGPFGQPLNIRHFERNLTGTEGDVTIRFHEKPFAKSDDGASNITEMGIELKITDKDSYDEWELQMRGVYYTELGQAILTTTSEKLAGFFLVPHLALSERTFEQAKSLLNNSISHTIQRQIDQRTDSLNPWHSRVDGSQETGLGIPSCDLVVYLQQLAPVTSVEYSTSLMAVLESELRSPTGAILPKAPDLRFSMLAFSPDCGYVLESKGPPDDYVQNGNHMIGPKMEVQHRQSRRHLLLFTLALALQLFLLMRQMREASTPSTRSRISFYTIAMLALGDGFATMTFLLISLFVSGLWVNLVGTGFLAFISVSFFGMRFLMDIWQVQAPERERRAREEVEEERRREENFQAALRRLREQREQRNAAQTETATNNTTTTTEAAATPEPPPTVTQPIAGVLPTSTPVIQRPVDSGATPVFIPSDQEGLETIGQPPPTNPADTNALVQARMPSFASLYTRFYLILLGALFLSLNATSWPAPVRRVFFTILGLLYFSFWVPQIIRNVQRNCRHALNWEFVIGQSILRLVPFGYFYGYEHNVLFSDIDYYSLALLTIWIWIQVVFLVSQELIGPRWFIRKDWAPPAYDYHPVLREDEEGATMPIGFSQEASAPTTPILERTPTTPTAARRASVPKESKAKGKRIFDCAICMQELEVPVIEAGASSDAGLAGGLLARRMYMVTPCRHIFHSACLEGWMKYRLQCPICRETLPPL